MPERPTNVFQKPEPCDSCGSGDVMDGTWTFVGGQWYHTCAHHTNAADHKSLRDQAPQLGWERLEK